MTPLQRIALVWGFAGALTFGAAGLAAVQRYGFGINLTHSLPNWAFVVDRADRAPRLGEVVEFAAPPNRYYPPGSTFVKYVWGVAGERVELRGRNFYVGGRFVGRAKERSAAGYPTHLGPIGIIPEGHYYVGAPHRDSLDSRYAEIGWIGRERIIGVARPIL